MDRFDALREQRSALGRPPAVLLADALATVAAEVLNADGVGITVLAATDMRVPIGASDPIASVAERLQFTVGDGPCFQVFADNHAATFDHDALDERWAPFSDGLTRTTPFRSVAAAPLGRPQPWGMVDAYHRQLRPDDEAPAVQAVTDRIAAVLGQIIRPRRSSRKRF